MSLHPNQSAINALHPLKSLRYARCWSHGKSFVIEKVSQISPCEMNSGLSPYQINLVVGSQPSRVPQTDWFNLEANLIWLLAALKINWEEADTSY
ncbi:hypothetical protein HNY73_010235 [Argiope bruennichi]|uniref:Uncharacterized protein n=1 Tax=Argiope bruennichi TaxID=94029 RepID=A0A8T0F6B4_ARGBR|nr:hypothetical protein HNY73_010235 [Argiope bruennichi]